MASQKKSLLGVKAQGMRWVAIVMKTFLQDFLYTAAKKLYYRKKTIDKNRRLVAARGTSTFLHYVRCLRDGFPDDERFQFGWGEFQASSKKSLLVFSDFLEKKKVFFSMETPIMGRHYFNDLATQAKGYFRVGLHGSVTLHRSEYNLPSKVDDKRLRAILHKTSTSLKSYRKRGEHILYPLQVPYDQTLQGVNPFQAAQYDLVNIKRYTSRPIVLTVNPFMIRRTWHKASMQPEDYRDYASLRKLCKKLGVMFYDDFKEEQKSSSIFLKNCWCVICHASSFTVEAVLAGIPALTLNPANFVYPICSHDLSEVENPKMPDRIPWFSRLAYCQWTLEEIARGDVWRHFQPTIERLLEKNEVGMTLC